MKDSENNYPSSNIGKCALFDREEPLRQSHIVPKLFYNYIKKDSGNHPFYSEGRREHKDGYKIPLLCQEAETLLSRYEKYFSQKIFRPIVYDNEKEVEYDSNLLKFVVSLFWRCIIDYKNFVDNSKEIDTSLEFLVPFLNEWKQYIIGNTDSVAESFYIFPIKEEWLENNKIRNDYHRAFLCDFGWNFYIDKDTITFYVGVPHFLFVVVFFSEGEDILFSNLQEIKDSGCINIDIEPTKELKNMLNYIGNKIYKSIDKVFNTREFKEKTMKKLDESPDFSKSNTCRIYKKALSKNAPSN